MINKFRGDAGLLGSGIDFLKERTGVPTLGVMPYLVDWRGDEEDSVALDERRYAPAGRAAAHRRAAPAVHLQPHGLRGARRRARRGPSLRHARRASCAGAAAIVLPGTKSTIADLAWLRERGLAAALAQAAAAGTPVIGICGGYQMLGRRILDPESVESAERPRCRGSACSM